MPNIIAIELETPFMVLDNMRDKIAYEGMYRDLYSVCPDEFKNGNNQWCRLFEHIFFNGSKDLVMNYRYGDAIVRLQRKCYIIIASSFEPSHEHKEAICAWMLSLMLVKCPKVR